MKALQTVLNLGVGVKLTREQVEELKVAVNAICGKEQETTSDNYKLKFENGSLREQLAKANEQIESLSIKNAELVEPLKKCPITRRKLFMVIDGKPTYGGPYDSYTIPLMEGSADEKWHERELRVERFDHDEGGWSDDEIIPMRIISEEYLYEIEEKLANANERVKGLEKELANKELLHVGFTNGDQVKYAKVEEGSFYPDVFGNCYIPLYMLKSHEHRIETTSLQQLRKEQE